MIRLRSLFDLVTKGPGRRASLSKRPQPFRPTLQVLEARETPSSLAHTTDTSGYLFGSGGGRGQGDGPLDVFVGHGHNAIAIAGN